MNINALLNPELIPTGVHPDLDALAAELAPLVVEWREQIERLSDLRSTGQPKAAEADRIAYAKALRSGAPQPGRVHSEEITRTIQATEERIEGLAAVIVAIGQDYVIWMKSNLDRVLRTLGQRDEKDRAAMLATVEEHRVTRARVQSRGAVRRMLSSAAAGTPKVLPPSSPAFQHLVGTNGDAIAEADLYEALVADATNVPVRRVGQMSRMGALQGA